MAEIVTRRNFLRLAGVASTGMLMAACSSAPAAQPTAAPAKPTAAPAGAAPTTAPVAKTEAAPAAKTDTFQADWDALVDAAKKEGKVVIQTPAGAGYREAVDQFGKAFPGIEAEHMPFPDSATYIPKITSERQAGIYSADALATTVTPLLQVAKPQGWLDPIRPLLIRPDVLDDKAWFEGFETRWADNATGKSHVFRFGVTVTRSVYVNTNLISPDEIKSVDDLVDPKWKGKICCSDLVQGYIYTPSTILRDQKGEAFLHKLFVEQEPMIMRDRRQAIETLVRGVVPIGFGLHPVIMGDFVNDGLAGHIKNLDVFGYGGGEVAALYNKAPHPKAGQLFINWLLTKEGQINWTNGSHQNSARLEVPPIDPLTAPGTGKTVDPTNEEWLPKTGETQEYLKKLQSERPAN